MLFLMRFLENIKKTLFKGFQAVCLFLVAFYKSFLSGTLALGGACRFYPSCGDYALSAYKNYNFLQASRLIFLRVLSCHPFGPKWWDEARYLREERKNGAKRNIFR